jgi:hypothetical protein
MAVRGDLYRAIATAQLYTVVVATGFRNRKA